MWAYEHRIPTSTAPQESPAPPAQLMRQQHHKASYYAHRVRESLTTRVSKLVCAIFLGLLFLVGLITFILWLSLKPHRPRFHVEAFSLAGNGLPDAAIIYNATASNVNRNMGIYYDSIAVAVFSNNQRLGGGPVLPPFYQEPENTTVLAGRLGGAALTVTGPQWQQLLADRTRGQVSFRVEITGTIRFKISTWDSKRHRVHANCPVGVGPDGSLLPVYRDKRCPVYFS